MSAGIWTSLTTGKYWKERASQSMVTADGDHHHKASEPEKKLLRAVDVWNQGPSSFVTYFNPHFHSARYLWKSGALLLRLLSHSNTSMLSSFRPPSSPVRPSSSSSLWYEAGLPFESEEFWVKLTRVRLSDSCYCYWWIFFHPNATSEYKGHKMLLSVLADVTNMIKTKTDGHTLHWSTSHWVSWSICVFSCSFSVFLDSFWLLPPRREVLNRFEWRWNGSPFSFGLSLQRQEWGGS